MSIGALPQRQLRPLSPVNQLTYSSHFAESLMGFILSFSILEGFSGVREVSYNLPCLAPVMGFPVPHDELKGKMRVNRLFMQSLIHLRGSSG